MIELNQTRYDLIVIGGGSAGMAAAIYAATAGKKVIVIDASGPRFDKPCGEGLMPPAISALKSLGIEIPKSWRLAGVKYVTESGEAATAQFSNQGLALGVRRRLLREVMWRRAEEIGVRVIHAAADRLSVTDDSVRVNEYEGAYLCIAAGGSSRLLRKLGLARRGKRKRPTRFGLRRHANIAPWGDLVEVHWRDDCELYVTPVSESCVNIAILSWKPIGFQDALNLFPEVKQKIGNASWDDEPAGRGPLYHRASRVQSGRVLVAGDAAVFIDAMTGEGNTLAIRSGIAAARAVVRGRPSSYRWAWLGVVWRYWLVTVPVLWMSRYVRLRRNVLRLVVVMPSLLRLGVGFLSADPD